MGSRRLARVVAAFAFASVLYSGMPAAGVAAEPPPLAGLTIALDPGHNGGNASHPEEISHLIWTGTGWRACATVGTTTVDGYPEHAFNWDVALRVKARLESLGATVLLTRSSDDGVGPCADERGRFGTEMHADLSVGIHADGAPSAYRGFYVMRPGLVDGFTDDIHGRSGRLAGSVRAGLQSVGLSVADYYATDGIKTRTDFATFNFSDIPVVMVELGNMKNTDDARRMKSAGGRDLYASGLVAGIRHFLDRPSGWSGPVARLAGPDRYATAAAISAATFPSPPVPVAYVATGANFPDALAGGPAAAAEGGPVLLVTRDAIPAVVATELRRLRPARIRVLGGPSVVSSAVLTALTAYTSGPVTRLAGPDRYATAATVVGDRFGGAVGPVFVATGTNFPDALAGGAAAAASGAPIVLAAASDVPAATMAALATLTPTGFVLLGGPSVLGPAVVAELQAAYPAVPVTRWSGPDRYATSAAISAAAFGAGAATAFLATGTNFPDALAGVPAAALADGPLLLTRRDCLPPVVAAELARLRPTKVVLLGGRGAIGTETPALPCGG
jgi:N-acetylmuramoyl-L-alanine amidase/putative cell wall-binding protein